jgi:polyhydroxybutyrate depolymerase
VNLHGHGGSAGEHDANTAMGSRGPARGFVVATPEALGEPRRWNFDRRPTGTDDYRFIEELVDVLVDRACVDPERVFVAGSSNGAAFAGFLACTPPFRFAAVAMVIATVPSTCPPEVTPSVLTIRGTADTTVPYGNAVGFVRSHAAHHRCPDPPLEDEPRPGVRRMRFAGCAGGAEVVLLTVVGGAHAWPGGARAVARQGPAAETALSATDEALDLFERRG